MSRCRARRGVGGLVGATVAIAVIVAAALYVLSNSSPAFTTTVLDPLVESLDSYVNEKISVGHTAQGFYVENGGSSPTSIIYLVVYNKLTGSTSLYRADLPSPCSISKTVLAPGEAATISCPLNEVVISIITSDGRDSRVFVRDPRLSYPYLIPRAVPQKVLLSPEVVTKGLERYVSEPGNVMIASDTPLSLYKSWSRDSDLSVSVLVNASLVAVLRLPGAQDRFNIMLIGSGAYGTRSSLSVDREMLDLARVGRIRFRIVIENFSGTMRVAGGEVRSPVLTSCSVSYGSHCRVEISGLARKVALYTNRTSTPAPTVGAFFTSGDLDGNGYPELVLITQDFSTGNKDTVNDRITIGGTTHHAVDRLESPIRVVFRDYPINNSKYSIAIVSVKMFFWDSSEDDILDNNNLVILRVGIYDPLSRRYLYSVELSYYELCRYRTVRPVTFSYIVKDFLLNIPPPSEVGSRELYIAIEIVDPYLRSGNVNDAEVIVGLEYVGLILGVRK